MEKVAKKKKSGWKWAFFLLLLLNMGVIIYGGSLFIASPTTDTHSKKEEITEEIINSEEEIDALITLGNKDLETLLLYALSENTSTGEVPEITISEDVIISGELEVLGFPIQYQLTAEPFVVEDGNLQLKVSEVALGRFTLPVKQVLQLLSNQMDPNLPLEVDIDNAFITVRLSEVETGSVKRIKLIKIEKELAEYTFNITIAKENLLQ